LYIVPQLLEYQQKKKKKKGRSKKPTNEVCEPDVSISSEPPSLNPRLINEAIGASDHACDNGTMVDDFGQHTLEDHGLPYDEQSTRLSTSMPIVSTLWTLCID